MMFFLERRELMARYLVTGGAGFIGSHLVDALLWLGHDVVIMDDLSTGKRENIPSGAILALKSIEDKRAIAHVAASCDGIFHLAAIASVPLCVENWQDAHRVNLGGTMNVFEVAVEKGIPVVYASSAAVYGLTAESGKTDERALPLPIGPYGADKLACEHQARAFMMNKGLRSIGLRFFNVFGARQDPASPYSGVISRFVNRARSGEDLTILGDGQQVRDFINVSDVVESLIASMRHLDKNEVGLVLNVCRGKTLSIKQLAHMIVTLTSSTSSIVHGPKRDGDIRFSCGDPSLAREILDWRANSSLEQGLEHLLGS